jgi:hypothetical protein
VSETPDASLRAQFDQLWRDRGAPTDAPPGAAGGSGDPPVVRSVHVDPETVASAARWSAASLAAAETNAALAAAVRAPGQSPEDSRAGLLRASAAAGASIAATAVGCARVDASILGAATVVGDGTGSRLDDDHVAGAFFAATPASPADDARVSAFVSAHPEVGLPALLQRVAAGDARAAAMVATIDPSGPLAAPLAAARVTVADAARSGDEALVALLRGRSIHTTADVMDLMARMDALLAEGDGLKPFNTLYRMVTDGVNAATQWEDGTWILGLDILFAELYFDGLESCLSAPDTAPSAWRVLVDRRHQPGISAVQFALAGMSAHINRDLAIAVVRTWLARGPADHGRATPAYRDYLRVNAVLDAVEPGAMRLLATGLFKVLDDVLEPADGWAAMAVVHAARDLAWSHAENLAIAGLDSDVARDYVAAIDAVAADAGRAALVSLG